MAKGYPKGWRPGGLLDETMIVRPPPQQPSPDTSPTVTINITMLPNRPNDGQRPRRGLPRPNDGCRAACAPTYQISGRDYQAGAPRRRLSLERDCYDLS